MTNREKFNATLGFKNCTEDGGMTMETFYPWTLTVERFIEEGMPAELATDYLKGGSTLVGGNGATKYLGVAMTDTVVGIEDYFGFDSVRRMFLNLPFDEFAEHGKRPPLVSAADWQNIKAQADANVEKYFTDENFKSMYGQYAEGHKNGDYAIIMGIHGMFWSPRLLFGIEEHMYALYDEPEMMHDIISYICDYYIKWLGKILDYITPDIVYIMEDLSGANGPMLSPAHFEEYVGDYYRKLIPTLKSRGVGQVFTDTDGDFATLIPNFMAAGVDGFLPMDVNAGMDIVKVRRDFPTLKFIGAYNKLEIAEGKAAIDAEFERLLPVIRQGGYIPGADHQVAPSTSLEDYRYYTQRLREIMKQSGADL